ncbi:MAG: UDP-N-acetylmuramate dehydrogenase [Bacteroidaceae bacterium]|nr:UDP-N-acetylmuramate dehydrogenase [Bacteroidaceae bacterium]
MKIIENCPLKGRNTFGMDVTADCLAEWSTPEELKTLLATVKRPLMVIGGGSNLLFMGDFRGTLLHSAMTTVEVVLEDESSVLVRVGAGVVWDDFVAYCVLHGWWGVENLSAIPGEVGASAVQNIGAYGVEAKDVIESVETLSVEDGSGRTFTNAECGYGYRRSIFKHEFKGQYVVTCVMFSLSKVPQPKLRYGTIAQEVERLGGPALENIRKAVVSIRDSKLPDPNVLGNAGSFFMNPVITEQEFNVLRSNYPDVPSYPAPDGMVKVPAGWLIEKTGWKGRSLGPAAVYEKQALVLVNKGGATGADIKRLADTIIRDVEQKFGITLSTEVNYI